MKTYKKIFLISLLLVILSIGAGAVSASQDNTTSDELTVAENVDIESSDINNTHIESSNDDQQGLEKSNDDVLTEDGQFLDVNDAYVYLNKFRTEDNNWQWNEDDKTKTVFNTNSGNTLQPLERDLNLEETAKLRAKEIAQSYSHTRPDNTSCFTAFPSGLTAMGENIAYGQTSALEVTVAWEENNDPYSGQGHRRNMLNSNFNCVGIAGYKVNGVIYWVQNFGKSTNINKGEIKYPDSLKDTATITAKKATFKKAKKTKKYTVTLNHKYKLTKKAKLTLKIGKKKYTATTNAKGKATFKITKLNKKGTYKGKITSKGTDYFKVTSKKVTIKIK